MQAERGTAVTVPPNTSNDALLRIVNGNPNATVFMQQTSADRVTYLVNMGERIGYVGGPLGAATENPGTQYVLMVIQNGNELITAFPVL
jgi:hypothetical protein